MQLPDGAVHLCLCNADVVQDLASCRQLLSADELARCERFPEGNRTEAVLTRALLRSSLSRYSTVDPADWRFAAAAQGKPYIESPRSDLKFNLSHSNGRIVCAVSKNLELGVDLQYCDLERNTGRLARRYFSTAEAATLGACEEPGKTDLFFDLWVLKEARTKATGGAVAAGLGKYGFDLSQPGVIASQHSDASYLLWEYGQHHRLALCAPGRALAATDVQVFRWQPLAGYEAQGLSLRACGGMGGPVPPGLL